MNDTSGALWLQSHDEELIERLLEEEREVRQFTQQQMIEEEEHVQKEKEKQKNELINDLVRSFVEFFQNYCLFRTSKNSSEFLFSVEGQATYTRLKLKFWGQWAQNIFHISPCPTKAA